MGVNDIIVDSQDALYAMYDMFLPQYQRRCTYRAKNLGSTITADQKANIRNGSFKGFFVGDYWVINGVNWRIVDINYWIDSGDTSITKPHLVIMPDKFLYLSKMNLTDTTTGGYIGSYLYTQGLAQAKQIINDAFGDALLSHKEYLSNQAVGGKPTSGAFVDSQVEIPDERMINGILESNPVSDGTTVPPNGATGIGKFSLFNLAPKFSIDRQSNFWCRNILTTEQFSAKGFAGRQIANKATTENGVRPVFAIG